jgi:alkanesulfonate monooxygenase SsuD/methylene tetrahydromethanopterin reductase-like flavin-dependent oxidoreductase (luciferase family)
MLEEQLDVITGLWSTPLGETFSFSGEHYQLIDAPALPKPVQHPIPVIVGGGGKARSAALAVKHAAEYNSAFQPDTEHAKIFAGVRAAAEQAGRDPQSLIYSVAKTTAVGTTEAEAKARAERIGRDPEELLTDGLGGTVAQVVDHLGRIAELGVSRVYLQVLDLQDLDHLELIAREVVPQLNG